MWWSCIRTRLNPPTSSVWMRKTSSRPGSHTAEPPDEERPLWYNNSLSSADPA